MESDDLIRETIAAAIDEILTDDRINPDDEIRRLVSMLESGFWQEWNERTNYGQDR